MRKWDLESTNELPANRESHKWENQYSSTGCRFLTWLWWWNTHPLSILNHSRLPHLLITLRSFNVLLPYHTGWGKMSVILGVHVDGSVYLSEIRGEPVAAVPSSVGLCQIIRSRCNSFLCARNVEVGRKFKRFVCAHWPSENPQPMLTVLFLPWKH